MWRMAVDESEEDKVKKNLQNRLLLKHLPYLCARMRQFVIRPLNAAGHVTAMPMPRMVRDD